MNLRDLKWNITRRWRSFRRRMNPDDMRIKLSLYGYLQENLAPVSQLGINRIKVRNGSVSISLSRPGLFIGRKGTTFYEIQDNLTHSMGKPIKIHLVEFDPFSY